MSKVRVYELAKEFGIENKEFIARLKTLGIAVKSHSSTLEDSEVERVRREFAAKGEMEVVEKRVKSTVIRRRAVRLPVGEAPEAEEAAAPAPEAPVEPAEPAGKEEGAAKPEKEEKDGIPEMPGKASLPEKTAETGIEEPQSAAAPLVSEKAPAKPELPPRKEPDLSRQAQIIRRPEPAGAKPASRPPAAITPQTQIRKPAGPARSAGAEARGAAAEADKKGKKAVEVVMDSVAAKKKSMIKQGIDKKDKRVRLREIEEE